MGQGKGEVVLPLGEAVHAGMALAFRAFGQQDGFAADVKNIVVFHPGDLRLGIFDGKRFRPFRRAEGAYGAQQAVRRTDAAAGLPQFHDG